MTTLDVITKEIVDLHDFFTEWFNGTIDHDQLEPRFLSHLHDEVVFIPPAGQVMTGAMLKGWFDQSHGSNPDFRAHIRDVTIRHEVGDLVLATYTEWQKGAKRSDQARNARVTSVLLKMTSPISWLHIHETWLPDDVRDAGSFEF